MKRSGMDDAIEGCRPVSSSSLAPATLLSLTMQRIGGRPAARMQASMRNSAVRSTARRLTPRAPPPDTRKEYQRSVRLTAVLPSLHESIEILPQGNLCVYRRAHVASSRCSAAEQTRCAATTQPAFVRPAAIFPIRPEATPAHSPTGHPRVDASGWPRGRMSCSTSTGQALFAGSECGSSDHSPVGCDR